jgi:hypothetical protein
MRNVAHQLQLLFLLVYRHGNMTFEKNNLFELIILIDQEWYLSSTLLDMQQARAVSGGLIPRYTSIAVNSRTISSAVRISVWWVDRVVLPVSLQPPAGIL